MSTYRLTVARTADEVETLRAAWAALPVESPTGDIDYHLTMIAHTPTVVRPHVVLLEDDDGP